jgi:hypothetical protein
MADARSELAAEITELEQKHADNPEGRYLVALANAYRKAGNLPHAERLLREGLKRHPESLSAHVVLGRCLADRGATREAADEFRYVLSIDPQNLIALRTLGELAATDGRTEEAGRWYRELLAVDPMNEDARVVLESLREPQQSADVQRAVAPEVQPEPDTFEDASSWWESPQQVGSDDEELSAVVSPEADLLRTEAVTEWPDGLEIDVPEFTPAEEDVELMSPAKEPGLLGDSTDAVVDEGEYFEVGSLAPADAPSYDRTDIDPDEGEVITETIADLYARQGFYDRAADVYRELIRRGGDNPALSIRLAEMEARLAQGDAAAPVSVPDWDSEGQGGEGLGFGAATEDIVAGEEAEPWVDTAAGDLDAFSASFAHGFNGDALTPPVVMEDEVTAAGSSADPTDGAGDTRLIDAEYPMLPWEPLPDQAPDEPVPGSPSIAEYLAGLLSWVPGSRASLGPAEPAAVTETPEPDFAWEQVTLVADPALLGEADGAEGDESREAEAAAVSESISDIDTVPAGVLETAPDEEEPFPWELPAPPPSAPAAQGAEGDLAPFSLENFFPEEQPIEVPQPAANNRDLPRQELAGGGAMDEDEDLESFQAWLRNLKR